MVTATDLNTRWLELLLPRPNLEVRQHDIGADPLDDRFDVVHVRNVLCHVRPAPVRPGNLRALGRAR
jgi:hypothetical protein